MKQYPVLPTQWQASYISQWQPMNPDNFISSGTAWFDYAAKKYAIEGLFNPWNASEKGYQLWISEKCDVESAQVKRKKKLIFSDRVETQIETEQHQGRHPLPHNVLEIWQAELIGYEDIEGKKVEAWQSADKNKTIYLDIDTHLPIRLELVKGQQRHIKTFFSASMQKISPDTFVLYSPTTKLPAFDPRSAEVIADPYPIYETYRTQEPLHFGSPLHQGLTGTWYAFSYDDINQVLKSKDFVRQPPNKEIALVPPIYKKYESVVSQWLVFQDPPNHTRIRSTLQRAFSGKAINRLESMITDITHSLLAPLKQKKHIEFISEFALPLPIIVICRLLGIPEETRKEFESLSFDLLAASFSVNKKDKRVFEKAEASMQGLIDYFQGVIKVKLTTPQDDLISLMLDKEQEEVLTHEEVISNCIHILNAGYETTINLISKGVYALQHDHQFYLEALSDPKKLDSLGEELLRFDNPVQMVTRWASKDTLLSDRMIKKGEQIALMLGSANRDPLYYPSPDKLQFERKKSHLSFGGGIHHCLGALLARLEAKVVFPLLKDIILNYQLDTNRPTPYEWNHSIVFHGFKSLYLTRTCE